MARAVAVRFVDADRQNFDSRKRASEFNRMATEHHGHDRGALTETMDEPMDFDATDGTMDHDTTTTTPAPILEHHNGQTETSLTKKKHNRNRQLKKRSPK